MPKLGEVASLAMIIFLFTIMLSIPAWLLVNTGNLSLLLVAFVWLTFSGIFASVYVLTNWVEGKVKKDITTITTVLEQTEACGNCAKFETAGCALNAVATDAPACRDFVRNVERKQHNEK